MASPSMMFPWFDELEAHLLLAEAHQAITGQPLDEEQLKTIEERAMSQLRPSD